jgi:hypothetical protein
MNDRDSNDHERSKMSGRKPDKMVAQIQIAKGFRFTYLHTMKDSSPFEVLNDLLDPLSRCLDAESARRVAEFRIAPKVEEKIRGLAEKANEGVLNEDERADYEAIINTADIISILKLKAERHLKSNGS